MGGALSRTGGAQAVVDFRRLGDRHSVATDVGKWVTKSMRLRRQTLQPNSTSA
jgi:hypothetical protein